MSFGMTLLYRSPNVTFGDYLWHAKIVQSHPTNPPQLRFLFRPIEGGQWRPPQRFPDRPPHGLRKRFRPYERSIRDAIKSARIKPKVSAYREAR